jgi:hypothetical protein
MGLLDTSKWVREGGDRDAEDDRYGDDELQHPGMGFFRTPSRAEERPQRSGAVRVSTKTPKKAKGVTEALSGLGEGGYTGGQSRWGGKNLTPGTVRADRNVRTEAHLWASEVAANGQVPVKDRQAWEVHADRMGFAPDAWAEGWDYIERVFNKRRGHVVADLEHVFEFKSQPYGGYSIAYPNLDTQQHASWPWRTKEAALVYEKAVEIIGKAPELLMIEELYEQALAAAKVSVYELTPEDDALMGMALQWLIVGKDAEPEPPKVPTSRNAYGMKGTQRAQGHYVPARGAP